MAVQQKIKSWAFWFRFLIFTLVIQCQIPWALGQEDNESSGSISSEAEVSDDSNPYPELKTSFNVQGFQNQTLRLTGYAYQGTIGLYHPQKYFLYGTVPFLYGQLRGKEEQEFGNPKAGVEGALISFSKIIFWGEASAKISVPNSKMAARYDSYRGGGSLRLDRGLFFSRMGAGYTFRNNEQDSRVNVGDVTDFELMVGRRFLKRWTGYGKLLWYRSQGVRFNELVIAKDAEWAGAQPGLKYRFQSGLEMGVGAIFPIMQTRNNRETEVSLWEIGFPRVSEITLVSELGVLF